jgi:hypothetical protein
MYVQSDQRATGLIHLLSLALRLVTLLEWRCRQRLAEQHESVASLYAGNPKRTTSRPTAKALLQVFRLIHLSVLMLGQECKFTHTLANRGPHMLQNGSGIICFTEGFELRGNRSHQFRRLEKSGHTSIAS